MTAPVRVITRQFPNGQALVLDDCGPEAFKRAMAAALPSQTTKTKAARWFAGRLW